MEWNSQLLISFRYSEVLKLSGFAGSRILLFYIELSSAEFC